MRSAHSQRVERWLGAELTSKISAAMRGFHGAGVSVMHSGGVVAMPDGDFVLKDPRSSLGSEASLEQIAHDENRRRMARAAKAKRMLGAIVSPAGLYNSISSGKRQDIAVAKAGATGVANISNTLWDVGSQPAAGSTSAAPGGSSPTNATTGALLYSSAGGGDSMYVVGCTMVSTVANNLLMAYDRAFQVNHNIATTPQTVSGVPTRYQDATAAGNFITVHVTTAIGAGTPTYTITYVDQDGNTAQAAAAQTLVASSIARRFPFSSAVGNGWFIPLAAGDTGVRSITNLALSAASTGNLDVVIAKPLMWIPQPIANMPVKFDGTISPLDFVPVASGAAIAFMEINKGATTATSYSGSFTLVSG